RIGKAAACRSVTRVQYELRSPIVPTHFSKDLLPDVFGISQDDSYEALKLFMRRVVMTRFTQLAPGVRTGHNRARSIRILYLLQKRNRISPQQGHNDDNRQSPESAPQDQRS